VEASCVLSESPGQILSLCVSKTFTVCSDISHRVLQKSRLLPTQQALLPAEAQHLSSSTSVKLLHSSSQWHEALNSHCFLYLFLIHV
jgi:hypothetical protein